MKYLAFLPLILGICSASAQVYKCPDASGKLQFQQTPCAGTAGAQLSVKPASGVAPQGEKTQSESPSAFATPTSTTKSYGDQLADERVQRERWIRLNDARIAAQNVRNSCEREQDAIRARQAGSNNNLAGATRNTAIAGEMQAAATTCQNRVSAADRQVDVSQNECDRLGCKAPGY